MSSRSGGGTPPKSGLQPRLRIGMFGLRGLRPDLEISGFETAFSEIAPQLAARGHDVTIYCRRGAHSAARRVPTEDGVRLLYMPSPGGKSFSAVVATLLAVLHGLVVRRYDVWFFVNVGMGHHCVLARASGKPVVLSVDGLDWQRGKWGPIGRFYFYSAARSAVRFCTRLITDAEAMRDFYQKHFGRDSTMIAYGAKVESSTEPALIERYGIVPRKYYLIVSRLIPENSLDIMIEGFVRSPSQRKLVIVGGANYADKFHDRLRSLAGSDPRIQFTGQIHDQELLKELFCNCYTYLHGHSVGGTNPALLRAMGYGCCVGALDTVFNREVLGNAGLFFPRSASAVTKLIAALDESEGLPTTYRELAPRRIADRYTWERIVDEYEHTFAEVARDASTSTVKEPASVARA